MLNSSLSFLQRKSNTVGHNGRNCWQKYVLEAKCILLGLWQGLHLINCIYFSTRFYCVSGMGQALCVRGAIGERLGKSLTVAVWWETDENSP